MGLFRTSPPKIYSLTVLTSTDCNLGCGYCFQNVEQDPTGGNRPPRISHARLTSETITGVLEFTRRRMAAAGLQALHVLLFGGEPLLNPRGCRELLARAADYGLVSASMISNGTLLTPLLAGQLAGLGLRSVQITFDGDAATHDAIRVRRSGGGTFEGIIRNITRVSETTPLGWALRVNVSHLNYAGIDALLDTLADRLDPSRCAMQFAWVGDVGIGYANEMRHTADLAERFFRWRRHALELGFTVSRPRAHLPCGTCSHANGLYGAVVNADGTLSSCWETAGKPGWQVGSVVDGYLPSEQTEDIWVSCDDKNHYSDDDRAVAAFNDAADAAFLDYLAETGRLRP
ncbi:radical SAM protein [Planobispora takensis]|nr:radical SAM protein [Planobispora takensis]